MEWLIVGLIVLAYVFLLLLVVVAFALPAFAWDYRKPNKPMNLRERFFFAWSFFFSVLFPWILMYGGVRYFYELGT
jgi:type II secretory pathway component PulF